MILTTDLITPSVWQDIICVSETLKGEGFRLMPNYDQIQIEHKATKCSYYFQSVQELEGFLSGYRISDMHNNKDK